MDELACKRIGLIGVTFRTRTEDDVADIVERVLADVGGRLEMLRPRIEATYPLDRLSTTLADLGADRHVGKLVVIP